MTQIRTHPTAIGRSPVRDAIDRVSRAVDAPRVPLDCQRALHLHRRLLAGDLAVIGDAARDESDTRPTLVVLLLGILTASMGAWAWLVIDAGGAGMGSAALNTLLLGTVASAAGWAFWLTTTRYALRTLFDIDVDPRRLLRSLAITGGFAVWQIFLLLGPASFAVGLIATVGAVLLAVLAVRAAAPQADDRATVISTALGFGVYAIVLSMVADFGGAASGVFVHAIG